jgi:hypothetical protein
MSRRNCQEVTLSSRLLLLVLLHPHLLSITVFLTFVFRFVHLETCIDGMQTTLLASQHAVPPLTRLLILTSGPHTYPLPALFHPLVFCLLAVSSSTCSCRHFKPLRSSNDCCDLCSCFHLHLHPPVLLFLLIVAVFFARCTRPAQLNSTQFRLNCSDLLF